MDIVRNSRHQAGRIVSLVGVLLATLLPALAPVVVSAATITNRSIALSSSVTDATSGLEVKFDTSVDIQSFDVSFCTAASGTCNAPGGLSASGVTATSGGTIGTNTANKIQVSMASAGQSVDFVGAGLTNPTSAGTIYARIATYSDDAYTNATDDTGAVALAFTDGVNVGGDVLETLTFCVQGGDTTLTDCSGSTAPDVKLGTDGVLATTGGASSGDQGVQTFLATNATSGAVVNLKTGTADCSGLTLQGHESDGDHGCEIAAIASPLALAGIDNTTAKFGMNVASVSDLTPSTNWSDVTKYYMDSDVTSAYGAEVLSTTGPVAAGTAGMTFAASATPITPAGHYYANLSMIATGKY